MLLELYSPRDVYDYLRPIALSLCADKVSSVRWISYKLVGWSCSLPSSTLLSEVTAEAAPHCPCSLQVSEMVKKLHMATPPTFGVDLINELVENFGRCPKWSGRQAFVFVCQVRRTHVCPLVELAWHPGSPAPVFLTPASSLLGTGPHHLASVCGSWPPPVLSLPVS